jgi:cell division protein FtsQ
LVDLEKTQKNLIENPWIKEASIQMQLPKTLIINITERIPKMIIMFEVPYLIDNEGEIFKRWTTEDPVLKPILTGISKSDLIEDEEGVKNIILDAIAFANSYNAVGLNRLAQLNEIHAELDSGFSLTAGSKEPFYIKFGHGPYRKKLNRLAKLLRKMKKSNQKPSVIFFDSTTRPDRVTVKLKTSVVR